MAPVSESPPLSDNMSDKKDEKEETSESNQQIFPNLSDSDLKQLGLYVQSPPEDSDLTMDEENIQSKYTSLVLAFKTDKMTLSRRLELQNKLRDQAELNMTHEVETLKSAIQLLSTMCSDVERNDLFEKIRLQIEALYKSALRVSSTAEVYGSVQQENRLSKAVDIMLKYVENMKQVYDKEKNEHEETRKLLKESKTPAGSPTDERRGSSSRRGSTIRRLTISKNDSQNDMLLNNVPEGDSFEEIFEGCETCGSRLRSADSNESQPNSSDVSSEEETRVFKRSLSFKEESNARKITVRQKFRKRTSFTAPLWVQKISKYLQWLQPYEDFALQVRYFIASLFVLAAFLIVAASFFQSSDS